MTQYTHTKAPWKYATNAGPTRALIAEADGSTIVSVSNRTRDGRFEANVKLMTLAPELLEMLEKVLTHYPKIDVKKDYSAAVVHNEAVKLIRRIRGE